MKIPVRSMIYTLEDFSITKTPPKYLEKIGLKSSKGLYTIENNELVLLEKNKTSHTSFYFLLTDKSKNIVNETKFLEKDDMFYLLAFDKGIWYIVSQHMILTKLSDFILENGEDNWKTGEYTFKQNYIFSIKNEEVLTISSYIDLFNDSIQLTLMNGNTEEDGREYLSNTQIKATRNIILVNCIIGILVCLMLLDMIISY